MRTQDFCAQIGLWITARRAATYVHRVRCALEQRTTDITCEQNALLKKEQDIEACAIKHANKSLSLPADDTYAYFQLSWEERDRWHMEFDEYNRSSSLDEQLKQIRQRLSELNRELANLFPHGVKFTLENDAEVFYHSVFGWNTIGRDGTLYPCESSLRFLPPIVPPRLLNITSPTGSVPRVRTTPHSGKRQARRRGGGSGARSPSGDGDGEADPDINNLVVGLQRRVLAHVLMTCINARLFLRLRGWAQ
jgi:hypothetical protein